jgi:hypothetical protein
MQIYLFASNSHPSVSAFTADKAGGNLPADYAPWFPVSADRTILIDSPSVRIAGDIQHRGYFLLAGGCAYSRAKREPPPVDIRILPKFDKSFEPAISARRTCHRPGRRRVATDLVLLTIDHTGRAP